MSTINTEDEPMKQENPEEDKPVSKVEEAPAENDDGGEDEVRTQE